MADQTAALNPNGLNQYIPGNKKLVNLRFDQITTVHKKKKFYTRQEDKLSDCIW